jgi:Zn-dependent protease with chaperone function
VSWLLLVTFSVALVAAWTTAACLSAISRCCAGWGVREGSTALRAAVVLAPLAVGVAVLVVTLLPTPWGECHCAAHGDGHPHLCFRHPWLAAPLVEWMLPIVTVWASVSAYRLSSVLRDIAGSLRLASELRALPARAIDGISVRIVDDGSLSAFTVGLWHPVVAIDRELWNGLCDEERRAVVHHESAHCQRSDALTQACLQVATALLPWSAGSFWVRAWRVAAERLCDRHAAAVLHDATSVAMALVSVERLRLQGPYRGAVSPALGVAAGSQLELRVRALLGQRDTSSAPLVSDLLAVGIPLLGAATLLLAWPGSFVHHTTESVLGFLTR